MKNIMDIIKQAKKFQLVFVKAYAFFNIKKFVKLTA